jgi:5-methylcytosine-specific restriction endonuclease McrA
MQLCEDIGLVVRDSPLARLALLVDEEWGDLSIARVRGLLEVVGTIAREEAALKLRHARTLAWIKHHDVAPTGFPNWTAFLKEHSPWRGSRTYDYLRLAESQLDLVINAAAQGLISLSLATRAARDLGPNASEEQQADWLMQVSETGPKRRRVRLSTISGGDWKTVEKGRAVSKYLVGWAAPAPQIDDFTIECFREKRSSEDIIEAARAVPPRPERLDRPFPVWKQDPCESLLGPWVDPRDLDHAMLRLDDVDALLEGRRLLLGLAYVSTKDHELWKAAGCKSLAELCRRFDLDQRTFERYAQEGRNHMLWPEARRAVEAGLSIDRSVFATSRAVGDSIHHWLDLAKRLCRAELARAAELENEHGCDLLDEYAPALERARSDEATARVNEATAQANEAMANADEAATSDTAARDQHESTRIGTVLVALRDDKNRKSTRPQPSCALVRPELLEASVWLLATVKLPQPVGIRKTAARDCYTCQNPRCRRTTLGCHVHHIIRRRFGGTDDPRNLVSLCRACHLRGIHSDWLWVVRDGDFLVWTWADGTTIYMVSP